MIGTYGIRIFVAVFALVFGISIYFCIIHFSDQPKLAPKTNNHTLVRVTKENAFTLAHSVWQVGSVGYINRSKPFTTEYYLDIESDGLLDAVYIDKQSEVPENSLNKTSFELSFGITDYNTSFLKNEKLIDQSSVNFFWLDRNSREAQKWQRNYERFREAYKDCDPEAVNFKENQIYKQLKNQSKIDQFKKLFEIYEYWSKRESNPNNLQSEIAQLKAYTAFNFMWQTYTQLNETEKSELFSNTVTYLNLGNGKSLPVKNYRAQKLLPVDFEKDFLSSTYMETDYMGAWSIFGTPKYYQIRDSFVRELKNQGLLKDLEE